MGAGVRETSRTPSKTVPALPLGNVGCAMQTIYFLRYYSAGGEMTHFQMRQCADDREAIQLATAACDECALIQIATDHRIVWSGSKDEAVAA
jgi:hypothetical protein